MSDGSNFPSLERLVDSLPIMGKTNFIHENGDGEKVRTPAHVLPLDIVESRAYGFFKLGETLVDIPVGFVYELEEFDFVGGKDNSEEGEDPEFELVTERNYFAITADGIEEEEQVEDKIYLPLKKLKVGTKIGDVDNFVLGVEGTSVSLPIVMVRETPEGIKGNGVHIDVDDDIDTHMFGFENSQEEWGDFLEEHTEGRGLIHKVSQVEVVSDDGIDWMQPKSIVEYLDRHMIGQHNAKVTLAVTLSNYFLRMTTGNEQIRKENLIGAGGPGVGKTFSTDLLAEALGLPVGKLKMSNVSGTGFVGESVDAAWKQIRASTKDFAPYGFVVIDEIGKLRANTGLSGGGFGPGVENELVGVLEEAIVLDGSMSTKNILFFATDAFQGINGKNALAELVRIREGGGKRKVGFAIGDRRAPVTGDNPLYRLRPEDFAGYGLSPELIRRFPKTAVYDDLTVQDKVRILTEVKDAPLETYGLNCRLRGFQVLIGKGVPEVIARYAPDMTGASSLDDVLGHIFEKIIFEPEKYKSKTTGAVMLDVPMVHELVTKYAYNPKAS